MNIKKTIFILLSIFLVLQSIKFTQLCLSIETTRWPVAFLIGWVINMLITGIFAFLGFALPTQKLIPDSYYEIKNSRNLKSVYKYLQVDAFRKFLLATIWKPSKNKAPYFDGTKKGITAFEINSKKSEFGHLIPFIIINILVIIFLYNGKTKLTITALTWNILGNYYPILLQRYHRLRISVLKKRYLS